MDTGKYLGTVALLSRTSIYYSVVGCMLQNNVCSDNIYFRISDETMNKFREKLELLL